MDILSVLICVKTVCKGNQQKTKVAASKERFNEIFNLFKFFGTFCLIVSPANNLNPNQAMQNVGPDMEPNCLSL